MRFRVLLLVPLGRRLVVCMRRASLAVIRACPPMHARQRLFRSGSALSQRSIGALLYLYSCAAKRWIPGSLASWVSEFVLIVPPRRASSLVQYHVNVLRLHSLAISMCMTAWHSDRLRLDGWRHRPPPWRLVESSVPRLARARSRACSEATESGVWARCVAPRGLLGPRASRWACLMRIVCMSMPR